ncbi:MAG: helix-turn-helix domain-containing protein [Planctomycetota bacterium]
MSRKAILHSTGPVIVPKDLPPEVRGERPAVGPGTRRSGAESPLAEPAAVAPAEIPLTSPSINGAATDSPPPRVNGTAPAVAEHLAPLESPPIAAGPPSDLQPLLDDALAGDSDDIYAESLELMERYVVTRILERTGGNQSQAARRLGITRGSLRNKIRGLGITIEQVVNADE